MKVKLLKSHTHEGKLHSPGDIIDLELGDYEWLANLKVAILVPPTKVEVPHVKASAPTVEVKPSPAPKLESSSNVPENRSL